MRPCPTKRSKTSRALWRSFPWNRYRGTRMCIILCEDPLLNATQDSFKTTLIQGNLGTCGRNILPIRHKRSHDTSSGESSTKKNLSPSLLKLFFKMIGSPSVQHIPPELCIWGQDRHCQMAAWIWVKTSWRRECVVTKDMVWNLLWNGLVVQIPIWLILQYY